MSLIHQEELRPSASIEVTLHTIGKQFLDRPGLALIIGKGGIKTIPPISYAIDPEREAPSQRNVADDR